MAYRNHLKWAHRLYLARTGRYMGRPDVTLRARAAPPAAVPRPTPVPSGPVPPRTVLPATARVQPIPLMGMQFPASRALAPRALMGIAPFPLVAEWRSQAASGRDPAMSVPAETARQPLPSPAQDSDLESLGPMDFDSGAPLLLEGEHALTSVPGYCDMDLVAAPDAAVGEPLDAPVPADLTPPLQPAALSVQRSGEPGQFPPQAPVAVCPPRTEPSVSCEGVVQADWDGQVKAAEASREFQGRRLVVPDWANMETAPVPVAPPRPAFPAPAPSGEAVADVPRPPLEAQDVLNAVRPSWYDGGPAHRRIVNDLLARYAPDFSRTCLLSALGWMLLQRQDLAGYLDWWICERQARQEPPADTLRFIREVLVGLRRAPFEAPRRE